MPWLSRNPAVNNVQATLLDAAVVAGSGTGHATGWWSLHDDADALTGVVNVTSDPGLGLSPMPASLATALAEYCHGHGTIVEILRGAVPSVDVFAERYAHLTGAIRAELMSQRMYEVEKVSAPTGVPGELRAAVEDDHALLSGWVSEFHREAMPGGRPVDADDLVRRKLTEPGLMWVWEDGTRPVSMNWVSHPCGGVVRLSGVFTPPELRRKGYAAALVAATSQYALDAGAERCVLYTDLANPTSNAIYQRLGYRPVSDARVWGFTAAAAQNSTSAPTGR